MFKQKMNKYTRPLCRTERIYLVYHDLCPPFANQIVLEGRGTFDVEKWRQAVQKASAANPGARLALKGCWIGSHWVDSGITPRVRVVNGLGWDGMGGPEGSPFEQGPLNPYDGTACEVVLIEGDPLRVAFRSHHAVMDGRATLFWAEEIFRALRGEPLLGSRSRLTELSMARSFQKKGRIPPAHDFIGPTGRAQGTESGVIWRRLHLEGRYRNLVAQVAVILAQSAWTYEAGNVRFGVSVDMRHRQPELRSTGNLTNLIYLNMLPGLTVDDVARDMTQQLEDKNDGMLYWGDRLIRYVPLRMLHGAVQQEIIEKHKTGRYRNSGIISNPGRLSLERLSCDTFALQTGFFIPPCQESLPIFIAMSGTEQCVEIMISMSRKLACGGRMELLIERLQKGLQPS
ncbi:MAG TPA: hypothetical protein PLR10_05725 [Smithella sp.]|nr:hypothetical protein [Smithella sp.]HQI71891.1 hypothetical protein [Smithella sp.]